MDIVTNQKKLIPLSHLETKITIITEHPDDAERFIGALRKFCEIASTFIDDIAVKSIVSDFHKTTVSEDDSTYSAIKYANTLRWVG